MKDKDATCAVPSEGSGSYATPQMMVRDTAIDNEYFAVEHHGKRVQGRSLGR